MIIDYIFKDNKTGMFQGRVSFLRDLFERFEISCDKNIVSIDLTHEFTNSITQEDLKSIATYLHNISIPENYSIVFSSYPLWNPQIIRVVEYWLSKNNYYAYILTRAKENILISNAKVLSVNSFTSIFAEIYHEDMSYTDLQNKYKPLTFSKKHYISANYQPKPHRSLIFILLRAMNIIPKGYVSVNQGHRDDYPKYTFDLTYDQSLHSLITKELFEKSLFEQHFLDKGPKHRVWRNWAFHRSEEFLDLNSECLVNVVTEATHCNRGFFTEKTMIPLILKRPFFMCCGVNSLVMLREQGYKTFDTLWDESYDSEPDLYKRYIMIAEQLKYLCSLSFPDLRDKIEQAQDILDHNYKTFFSFDHKKHILKLLENI